MASELIWYYGPVSWDKNSGSMWHRDCPQEPDSEVSVFKDGSLICACGQFQEPEELPEDDDKDPQLTPEELAELDLQIQDKEQDRG